MILVTGGTGLLGSHLLYKLTSEGERPRAIKRQGSRTQEVRTIFSFYTNEPDRLFSRIEWVDADILIPESLDDVFADIDRVYHAAAMVSFNPSDHKKMILNNQEGTSNIVDACLEKGSCRLLHVSSTSALGSSENGSPVTEQMIWSPEKRNTGYSVSKFRSEMEVWRGMEDGLNAVIVNPSIIFGPGFWDKGSSSMFTTIKKGLKFYTEGVTGYVWVMDVVNAMTELMNSEISGERFILNSENLSYRQVFTMIAEALGVKAPSVEVSPLMAALAWRLDSLRAVLTSKRLITRETIEAGKNVTRFSNDKIKNSLNIEFRDIKSVIEDISRFVP